MTHRFFGRSIADLVMPLQREKTALKRGAPGWLHHLKPRNVERSLSNESPNETQPRSAIDLQTGQLLHLPMPPGGAIVRSGSGATSQHREYKGCI